MDKLKQWIIEYLLNATQAKSQNSEIERTFSEIEDDVSWIESQNLAPVSTNRWVSEETGERDLEIKATVQVARTKYAEAYIQTSVKEYQWELADYADWLISIVNEASIYKDKYLSEKELIWDLPRELMITIYNEDGTVYKEFWANINIRYHDERWVVKYTDELRWVHHSLYQAIDEVKNLIRLQKPIYIPEDNLYVVRYQFDCDWKLQNFDEKNLDKEI